jgi:hypothetical protein
MFIPPEYGKNHVKPLALTHTPSHIIFNKDEDGHLQFI